jgi:hypothetical protein
LKVVSALLEKRKRMWRKTASCPRFYWVRSWRRHAGFDGAGSAVSDTSKMSVERLSGVPAPKFEDSETSFEQLQERIASTIAYIDSVNAGQMAAARRRKSC